MKAEIRTTTAADVAALVDQPLPYRIKAVTLVIDGEPVAIGGLGFRPDGIVVAFAHQKPGTARRYPLAFHKTGLAGLRMFATSGATRIFAEADTRNPAAERWLERLGFTRITTGGATAFVWERDRHG